MTPQEKDIHDVQNFWNAHPLLTDEVETKSNTAEWFKQFDTIKNSVFLDNLEPWIGPARRSGKLSVLDVGCGPGFWNRALKDIDCIYTGIDISSESVAIAREGQSLLGTHGKLVQGNAEQLDFPDEMFDHVISEGVIHHTPDTQKCADEIYRVLKQGGTATVSVYYKSFLLSPVVFPLVRTLMRIFRAGLKGRGRESMWSAKSPEEFVRMYDGAENPIGKAYSKKETLKMFEKFSTIRTSTYYFPQRALPITLPPSLLKFCDNFFGTLIRADLTK